jgi:hypothetical protein
MNPESTVFRFTVLVAASVMQAVVVARGVAFLLETVVLTFGASLFRNAGEPPAYLWDFAARTTTGVMMLVLLVIAVRMMSMPPTISLAPRELVAATLFAGAIIVVASGLADVAGVVGRTMSDPSMGFSGIGEAFGAIVRCVIIGGLFAIAGYAVRPKGVVTPAVVPAA